MSTNRQTIAQIPIDISDDQSLARFLRTLVDNLDTVLGYKGDARYITSNDVVGTNKTVAELADNAAKADNLVSSLRDTSAELEDTTSDLVQNAEITDTVVQATTLNALYYDLNDSNWSSFIGCGYAVVKGSDLQNNPASVPEDSNCLLAVESCKLGAAGILQKLYLSVDDAAPMVYARLAVGSSWTKIG